MTKNKLIIFTEHEIQVSGVIVNMKDWLSTDWVNLFTQMETWCKENCSGEYNFSGATVKFQLDSDALLFLLRWQQKVA